MTENALQEPQQLTPTRVGVLILGAGVCGVAAAIGCRRAGFEDFVIIERAGAVGGTWHHNTYPGCAVDVPSHIYSFSYAPNPDWNRLFAPQAEVEGYLQKVAADFELGDRIRFGVELLSATWVEADQVWDVTTSAGRYLAQSLVLGAGPLHEAVIPDLPGLSDFTGDLFHSAHWPADLDLAGKNVVVVGTGPSALQFVPEIQPEVAQLTLLQRTPSWVLPKLDWKISRAEKWLLRHVPGLAQLSRWVMWLPMDQGIVLATRRPSVSRMMAAVGRLHLRRQIPDKATREALTPTYRPTCKRLGLSNNFYPAVAADNVELVTDPPASLTATTVITQSGREIPADVVIMGTGFQTIQHHPINARVTGRGGRTLEEVWDGNPTAYLGTTISGFPNCFYMFGPNIGTLSGFVMAEAQTDYLVGALKTLRAGEVTSVDVLPEAQQAFVDECDEQLATTTFVIGGCTSYYLADGSARASLPWPYTMRAMRRRLRRFDLASYRVTRSGDTAPTESVPAARHRSVS